jgi:hypothetical protein
MSEPVIRDCRERGNPEDALWVMGYRALVETAMSGEWDSAEILEKVLALKNE